VTTLLIDHSQAFQYGGDESGYRTSDRILEAPSVANQYLISAIIDHVWGYSNAASLLYFQIHNGLSSPDMHPPVNSIALISIPVPAGMPFSWTPAGGFWLPTYSFWWTTSSQGPTYQPPGGSFRVQIKGRATVGPQT
jgi:hypothetical protein